MQISDSFAVAVLSGGAFHGKEKRSQYFLSAGAVLQVPFQGALYQVGHTGAHPVYRYGRPLLLGCQNERAGSFAGL